MCGVEEPLLPEPGAVEGGATQSEGAIETQEARYPWLHKTARLRSLDVWVEISKSVVRDAKFPGNLGGWFVCGRVAQTNGLCSELWCIARCCSRHRYDSLRRRSHPKLWCVHRPGSRPLRS